jgi:hypothetical protein
MQAKETELYSPVTQGTFIMVRENYKIMYFFGYEQLDGRERIELYDIEADPEELNDLYPSQKRLGDQLLGELKAKMAVMDKPYL